jgi:hypothetical protein
LCEFCAALLSGDQPRDSGEWITHSLSLRQMFPPETQEWTGMASTSSIFGTEIRWGLLRQSMTAVFMFDSVFHKESKIVGTI